MSLEYIRTAYNVPAKRGGRVSIMVGEGLRGEGCRIHGVITGAKNQYLRIRIDGRKRSSIYHPTDGIEYETPNAEVTGLRRSYGEGPVD